MFGVGTVFPTITLKLIRKKTIEKFQVKENSIHVLASSLIILFLLVKILIRKTTLARYFISSAKLPSYLKIIYESLR
jgi:hypothetical protein